MAQNSKIEWTQATWNPVTGCTKISPGCQHCYAERLAKRLHAMGQPNYRNNFRLTLQPQTLDIPRRWKKPRTIFVNSMSDPLLLQTMGRNQQKKDRPNPTKKTYNQMPVMIPPGEAAHVQFETAAR